MPKIKLDNTPEFKLGLKLFQMDKLVPDPAIAMVAKRGSGKSWVIRDVLRVNQSIPSGIVISPTDKMSSFYKDFVPDIFIYYDQETEPLRTILTKLLEHQVQKIEKQKTKLLQGKKIDPRAFLVMDDCLASKSKWLKEQTIREIFQNGRHYKLLYILAMQFPLGIPPELRSNFDYVFLLREDFASNLKRIYDHYAGMFPTFNIFQRVFNICTAEYRCMVINNRGSGTDLTDKVFFYKAKNIKNFTVGCAQYKLFHTLHYNPNFSKQKSKYTIEDGNIKVNFANPNDKSNIDKNNEKEDKLLLVPN